MYEKRRSRRMKADLKLNVSNLFKQDNVSVGALTAPITVVNVSKHGIGFLSTDIIPLDFYFNAALNLGGNADDVLYCVVRIIRCVPAENNEFMYGCEFVGMAPVLDYIFENYEKTLSEDDFV